MSENLHDIDQYFKNGLEGHEETPDPAVWEALDNQLDKVETVHLRHKYAQLKYWTVAVTVVLTTALIYLYQTNLQHKTAPTEPVVADSPSTQQKHPLEKSENNSTKENNRTYTSTEQPFNTEIEANNKTKASIAIKENKTSFLKHTVVSSEKMKSSRRFLNSNQRVENNSYSKGEKSVANDYLSTSNLNKNTTASNQQAMLFYHSFPKRTGLKEKGTLPEPGYKGLLNTTTKSLAIKNPITRKNLLAVGLYHSAEKPFQRLEEGRQEHDEDDKNAIMNGETVQSSINYGVVGSFSIGKNLSLQTGVSYSKKISTIAEKQVYARRPDFRNSADLKFKFNCTAGYTYIDPKTTGMLRLGDSIKVTGSTNELSYVELPVLLNYQLGKGRFHVNLLGGMSANLLQKGTLETSLVNSWGTKIPVNTALQGLKKMYLSAMMGAGVEYDLFPTISLYAQEVVKGSLGSINQNAPAKTYANSTGLQLGLRVRL